MAEIRHLENRHDVNLLCSGPSDLDKILQAGAEWHVDCGDMVEIETRSRIPIWRTFWRIQWRLWFDMYSVLSTQCAIQIVMPPPRRGALSGHRRLSSVCPFVCLMSRTSAVTRKPKGLGRRNFAQGYPRSHATPAPTSRSKGQKSRSRGQLVQRSEMCQYFANG